MKVGADSTLSIALSLDRTGHRLDFSAALPAPGITGVFGRSGAGKTTLLRCVAGLEPAASGKLVVGDDLWADTANGYSRPVHDRAVGYVFQEPRLFPHMTVMRNLDYGRRRNSGADVDFDDAVDLLGIAELLERKPASLSGGEAQRVAIARALLRSPRLLLMDEPLASLDDALKQEILPYLDRLHATLELPVMYVSHSLDEVCRLCDHLVVLEQGTVAASGPIQDVLTSLDNPVIAGGMSILTGEVVGFDERFDLSRVRLSSGDMHVAGRHETGRQLRMIIRAGDVSLCREQPLQTTILNILPVTVDAIKHDDGPAARLRLVSGSDVLVATITRRSAFELAIKPGERLYAQVKSVSVRAAAL